MNPDVQMPVLGWREWVALPDIGVAGVKAKIDTGARSSVLHTHDYEVFTENGVKRVRFHLHPLVRSQQIELECVADVRDFREVKDSGGHPELRPFLRTRAKIGGWEWEIDLSLTNREGMKFRMLLGRAALARRFLVHPSRSYLIGPRLHRVYEF